MFDGPSGMMFVGNGDAPNVPVEVIESRYPLRITRYSFNDNNSGIGKYRGGYGVIRNYEMLEDNIFLQTSTENNKHRVWGLSGGGDAGISNTIINEGTEREINLDDRVSDYGPLMSGETLTMKTANGGGWGHSSERDINSIAEDVKNDFLDFDEAIRMFNIDRGDLVAAIDRQ
jgi:N-methylhydantoinase B